MACGTFLRLLSDSKLRLWFNIQMSLSLLATHYLLVWPESHTPIGASLKAECDKYLFLTEYKYQIFFGFQKSLNTKYWIVFGIEKIGIPTTVDYFVLRKSEYQIQIVLFGLTIWIQNTKYLIVYKLVEKNATEINIFVSYETFCSQILCNYLVKYLVQYSNAQIVFGVPEKRIPNIEYYSVLRKFKYQIRILLFSPTIWIVFEYQIIRHTLLWGPT